MDRHYARMAKLENHFKPDEEGREGMSDQNARTASRSHSWTQGLRRPGFNLLMVYAGILLLVVSVVGCRLTSVNVPNAGFIATTLAFVSAAVLPFALYLQEKGKLYIRDAALVILWSIFLTFILNFPVVVAARLGLGIGLQDAHLAQWDKAIGVSVPGVSEWAKSHWLGLLANKSYFLLFPLMRIAILLPALCGKVKHAQQFLLANVLAFALGLPIFSVLPAVGPWYGYHLAARPDQAESQALLLLLRQPWPLRIPSTRGNHLLSFIPCHLGHSLRTSPLGISLAADPSRALLWRDHPLDCDYRRTLLLRCARRGRLGRCGDPCFPLAS